MPKDGTFDLGNNVEYAGGGVYAMEKNIFWNYHGEFWKNSQTNIWNHYHESGLMVSQFGIVLPEAEALEKEAYAKGAGNVFSSTLVKVGNDYYIYHNDESVHGGVHRWKISGLNSIIETNITVSMQPITGTGLIGNFYDGVDLNNFNMKISSLSATVNLSTPPSQVTSSSNFSAKWTGYVRPANSQAYTFYTNTSKGVKLWINNVLVIDRWSNASLFENSSAPITLSAGVLYAVRMEISGGTATLSWQSASQSKQVIPSTALFPGAVTSYANGYNLMEGLELQSTLENNKYGWSRNSTSEINIADDNYWRNRINTKSHLIDDPSLFINFRKYNAAYYVTRDLGTTTNCTKQWSISGALLFENNYPNSDPNNEGFFDILDDQGRIISRLSVEGQYINSNTRVNQVKLNGTSIVNTLEKNVFANFNNATNFSISASGKTLTFTYANYTPITVRLYDTTANWFKPKTIKFHFRGGDYDKAIDVRQLRFTPIINTTPVLTNSGQNSFCSGSSVTLTAPLGTSYVWNTNATTRSISVNSSGTYSVTVNFGNSCVLNSAITTINVKPSPTPSISLFNNGLLSSYTAGNQWYMNGVMINGARSQLLRVTRSGSYSVIVTDTNGCQGVANFNVPLPFKDVKIESECLNDKEAKFTWYTMDSEDEFKYGIEYTLNNGVNWIKLGEVNAVRQFIGQTLNTYSMVLERNNDYKTIYRWYSLDQTGKRVQAIPIANLACDKATFKVYPNPFNTSININFDLGTHTDKSLVLDILDLNGKVVYQQALDFNNSNSQTGLITINEFEQLSNGIYQLRIAGTENIILNEKIVKTN
jgi:hypothetical protein